MKTLFLTEPVVNTATGEEMPDTTGSVADLSVSEMCQYIDKITKFASDFLNTPIPPASDYYEAEPTQPETTKKYDQSTF